MDKINKKPSNVKFYGVPTFWERVKYYVSRPKAIANKIIKGRIAQLKIGQLYFEEKLGFYSFYKQEGSLVYARADLGLAIVKLKIEFYELALNSRLLGLR